jgi:hypothetical protein
MSKLQFKVLDDKGSVVAATATSTDAAHLAFFRIDAKIKHAGRIVYNTKKDVCRDVGQVILLVDSRTRRNHIEALRKAGREDMIQYLYGGRA